MTLPLRFRTAFRKTLYSSSRPRKNASRPDSAQSMPLGYLSKGTGSAGDGFDFQLSD
ncbi:MAG: hypothetical protein OXF73_10880 [Gammaproteobacteria bacterium]|nr:hypothetical protein [Gammaproteobacteria bacterium]